MIGIVASLMGTKVGRWVASGLLLTAVAAYIVWNAFNKGKASAEAKRKIQQLEAIRDKVKTDEEIRNMPADKRRDELAKWVRD